MARSPKSIGRHGMLILPLHWKPVRTLLRNSACIDRTAATLLPHRSAHMLQHTHHSFYAHNFMVDTLHSERRVYKTQFCCRCGAQCGCKLRQQSSSAASIS